MSRGDAVEENDTDSREFVDEGKKNAIRKSNNKTNISKTSSKLIMKGTQKLWSIKKKIITTCSI